jgi:Ca-activated chloride channel homolog
VRARRATFVALAAALVMVACTGGDDSAGDDDAPATTASGRGDPGDCIVVDMAVSSEKIALLSDLADSFNSAGGATVGGRCVFVRPRSVASGLAATLIPQGWPDIGVNGEPPVIWSPAASAWAGIVNDRAGKVLAPAGTPFMLTPLVIAMPKPMAEALGWPNTQLGFKDLLRLAQDPQGGARSVTPSGDRSASARRTPTSRPAGSTSRSPSTTRRSARRRASRWRTSPARRRSTSPPRSSRRSSTTATSR